MKNAHANIRRFFFAFLITFIAFMSLVGCTANERAKNFGGTCVVKLPAGKKLINATFKENNLWFLTRDAKPGEKAEVYEFIENSSLGMLNGKVVIWEQ